MCSPKPEAKAARLCMAEERFTSSPNMLIIHTQEKHKAKHICFISPTLPKAV